MSYQRPSVEDRLVAEVNELRRNHQAEHDLRVRIAGELETAIELLRRVLAEDGLRPSTEAAVNDYLRVTPTVGAAADG